jgi:hemoglobin
MTPPFEEITETTIRALVDAFYARVRCDPALGPIFARAIVEDAWPAHLDKMHMFWSSVMLTSGRYKGNPVSRHRDVVGIVPPLFESWLDLFAATAADLFIYGIADKFARIARRVAESLKLALFFQPDRLWPDDLRRPSAVSRTCA